MQVTLLHKNRFDTIQLPEKREGQFYIYNEAGESLIEIEGKNDKWIYKSTRRAWLTGPEGEKLHSSAVEDVSLIKLNMLNAERAMLFAEQTTEDRNTFRKYNVAKDSVIPIGRAPSNAIMYDNKYISSEHCIIRIRSGQMEIEDTRSVNGTFVNSKRIEKAILRPGDVIHLFGLKIIVGNGLLAVNNPDGLVNCSKELLLEWVPQVIEATQELEYEEREEQQNSSIFYRSPRFKKDIKTAVFKIDSPPPLSGLDETPLMLLLGPSMTMGMASLFTGLFTINNVLSSGGSLSTAMPTLIMSMSMLLGTILWPIITKRFEKKRKIAKEKERQEKYKKYLAQIKEDIAEETVHQALIVNENNVHVEQCVERIQQRKRNLWERSVTHDDFCTIRLGVGQIDLDAEIKAAERKFELNEDNLQNEMLSIAEAPLVLDDVPVTISLLKDHVCGVVGPREATTNFAKNVIFQLAGLHSYDEVKMLFFYDKREAQIWNFVKWLPHCWDNSESVRFVAIDAFESKELSAYLENEFQLRKNMAENDLTTITPHYVIFASNKTIVDKIETINQIIRSKIKYGFSVVCLYDELNNLPKECSKVIELSVAQSKIYDKNDITGENTNFTADEFEFDENQLARELSNIQLNTLYSAYALPNMLTFLEMYGVGKIEHLNVLTRWKENDPTITLQAAVGVDTSGDVLSLDLHEKFHGPHGLIAGMTGSGKSEFIITYILSLAINYHPNEVAFILIDYKGGGMAKAFEKLPHTAGIITNLDGTAVKRSLISIQSELKRRQGIFSAVSKSTNVSNIDIYKYQRLYRDGVVKEPLQHLFIISDEFAELKTQQPDFMQQLISAARIGRSLGVHLILATQKPSGVVDDQIWSNSKFRVCLKVQEKADSMDMLKRSDAAELSVTGRFYLQVGYNELFEIGQSAWAGAPYYPSDQAEKQIEEGVSVIDNLGRVVKQATLNKRKLLMPNPSKQLDEVTNYLSVLAKGEKVKARQLWLEPIPANIYLNELNQKYHSSSVEWLLNPVVGELDNPANQQQQIMTLPISTEGNAVIYGVSGSGKTTFVNTMLYSLIAGHTPDELNIYLLDFGSETLKVFAGAPHVGDVLFSHEREKISNLLKMLSDEITRRKKMFSDFGGDYLSYNRSTSEKIASIVVVIQNYSVLSETYEDLEESITFLTREGTKYGIYFVVTTTTTNAIRYRMLQNFKQLLVLQMNDTSEYSGILGNTDGVFPSKFKGRGIIKTEETYEFQTASIAKDEELFNHIKQFCKKTAEEWKGKSARKVPMLPDTVDTNFLADYISDKQSKAFPIGVEKISLSIATYDFEKSYINLILSQSNENAQFIQGLAEVAIAKEKIDVTILDGNGNYHPESAKAIYYFSDPKDLCDQVQSIFMEIVERNNTTKDELKKGNKAPNYPKRLCIINSLTDLIEKIPSENLENLKELLEKGDKTYNFTFVIQESIANVPNFAYESWYKKHITGTEGIWIGNGVTEQYQLKISKITNNLYDEIGDDFGYSIKNGKPTLIKLLSSMHSRQEV